MIENIYLFILSSVIMVITPGLDTMLVLNTSLTLSRRAGVMSAVGISMGIVVHTLLVAVGLSVALTKSVVVFATLKYLGALYLIYLGLISFKKMDSKILLESDRGYQHLDQQIDLGGVFLRGLLTNILNPKVAIFFLAFFPQFVSKDSSHPGLSFAILGGMYFIMTVLWLVAMAIFVSFFSEAIRGNLKTQKVIQVISGGVFVVLGLRLAFLDIV